jgi:hypothetical protein
MLYECLGAFEKWLDRRDWRRLKQDMYSRVYKVVTIIVALEQGLEGSGGNRVLVSYLKPRSWSRKLSYDHTKLMR